MRHMGTNLDGNDSFQLDNGEIVGTGLKPADMSVMRAAPQYVEAYPLIPESQYPKPGEKKGGTFSLSLDSSSQAQTSACGGYGSVNAFAAQWNFTHNEKRVFSHDYVYGMVNGGRDQGSRPEELRDQLVNGGVCLKTTVGPQEIYSSRYPQAAHTEAKRFRADQAPVITTPQELITAILRGQGVFSGLWCGGNFRPNAKGIIPPWDGRRVGGHCTAQIGEIENIDGVLYAWTLNSWFERGKTGMWGVNGWAAVPIMSYFPRGLYDFAAVAIVSVRSDPNDPTPTPEPQTAA